MMNKEIEIKVDRYTAIVNCKSVKEDTKNRFACHIPAYDMFFSSKEEDIERKAKAMMKAFFDFYKIK